jgi:DNA-directed RNA polymerase subunit M/transcription elongation factor TFIIS
MKITCTNCGTLFYKHQKDIGMNVYECSKCGNINQEEPKQETLEEVAANLADPNLCKTDNWIAGANYQAERMYSEEEVVALLEYVRGNFYDTGLKWHSQPDTDYTSRELLEQFKIK